MHGILKFSYFYESWNFVQKIVFFCIFSYGLKVRLDNWAKNIEFYQINTILTENAEIPKFVVVIDISTTKAHNKFESIQHILQMERHNRIAHRPFWATFCHRNLSKPLNWLNLHFQIKNWFFVFFTWSSWNLLDNKLTKFILFSQIGLLAAKHQFWYAIFQKWFLACFQVDSSQKFDQGQVTFDVRRNLPILVICNNLRNIGH